MDTFELGSQPYVALVQRMDVETTPDDPVRLAIYAPGSICLYGFDHRQEAASLSYGFLTSYFDSWPRRRIWGFAGSKCLTRRHQGGTNPQPWKTALDRRHFLAGTGLDLDWRRETWRPYWRLVKLMGLILQVEPNRSILRGYLGRATRNKRPFTPNEKRTLLDILRERGGTERAAAGDKKMWQRELDAHLWVIKRRRDLAFRLARLATLDLSAEDRSAVESLQAYNVSWRNGRMRVLDEGQKGKVAAMEAQYRVQRAEAAQALTRNLMRQFGLDL